MRLNIQERQTHFFLRIFLFNVIIVILVTCIPVVIYYQYFTKAFNEQLENLNLKTVMQFRNAIDEKFLRDSMRMVPSNFVDNTSDETLIKPMTDSIRNDSKAILSVINQLQILTSNLPYVHSIDVYYKNNNVLFYNNRFCFLSENACTIGSRQLWLDRFKNSEEQVSWLPPRPLEGEGSEPVITFVRSIPYFATPDKRKAIIAININEGLLMKSLQALRKPSDGLMLIIDSDGNVIAHNQLNYQVKELGEDRESWISKVLAGPSEGMFNQKIADNSTMVSYTKSEFNNWYYISLVNKDSFYKKSNDLKNWLISFVLMFLLVSILIAYILTKRAHKPIRNVIGHYYTQIADLNYKVEINKPVIRHNYIMSLLHDELSTHMEPLRNEFVHAEKQWNRFFCFVIEIPKNVPFENEQAASYHLIGLLESCKTEAYQVWAIKDYGRQIQGVLFMNESAQLSNVIEEMVEQIELIYKIGYVLSIGGMYAIGERTISASYQEAVEALKYVYLYPYHPVLTYSELTIASRQGEGGSVTILDELEVCIRICDEKKARQLVEKIKDDMMNGLYTVEYCKNLYADVITTVRKVVDSMGFSSNQLFGYDIREKFKELENVEGVTSWTMDLIKKAITSIEDRKMSFDSNIEVKIKTFIHEHLFDDISLERVADEMNISANYLGKLFKKNTGINFTEYLTDCRLIEAEKLLKEKKLSVNEIASKLGYSSTNHFIRIFKEKYGETPKKYQLLFK
ncbi:AraC family transcriptional regulator [Paenibacillus roseipurpureus]|uniref:AraC family transcriptional regulator n=1 Tax=Paenibacillus roseopurpureus TaxID=2918901 RepID=A0AA96RJJ3_9BACL|nr:AraC family transcriptional regulator [Paenibacillus sp. MBLB1832]WNR45438.1 AraC family transcriptional regulator [Paenibacillus sp. MBLB1832]